MLLGRTEALFKRWIQQIHREAAPSLDRPVYVLISNLLNSETCSGLSAVWWQINTFYRLTRQLGNTICIDLPQKVTLFFHFSVSFALTSIVITLPLYQRKWKNFSLYFWQHSSSKITQHTLTVLNKNQGKAL